MGETGARLRARESERKPRETGVREGERTRGRLGQPACPPVLFLRRRRRSLVSSLPSLYLRYTLVASLPCACLPFARSLI